MKNLKTLLVLSIAGLSIFACKTTKMVTDNSNINVVETTDLKNLNFPLADTIMKYSMAGLADVPLTNEMVSLSKEVSDNMNNEASVSQYGQAVIVSFDKGNAFAINDYLLNENMKTSLRKLAFKLKENPSSYVVVFGRADATGPVEYNEKLAQRRATTVANYLLGCTVEKERLFVDSFGEKFPDFKNNTSMNMNKNRRVDILIIPSNGAREVSVK
jgi:outer membrane protein OmpA-like peptidoglycan-associated protein